MKILFEDNHLLVAIKPVNLPTQADSSGDADFFSTAKQYIKEKYNKPGDVYLGLVHRLDRPVGGIMVFARTSKAAQRLTDSLQKGLWRKTYFAVADGSIAKGSVPQYAKLTDYIVREGSFSRIAGEKTPGAQRALLSFSRIAEKQDCALLKIELVTGRHHQIRVQLQNAELPIWGDMRYNPNAQKGNIALYAGGLAFPHPVTKEMLEFRSLPETFPFTLFDEPLFFQEFGIVFDCPEFAVLYKPQGMITCMADTDGENLEYLSGMTACHRLDATTGGLIIMAKSVAAQVELEQQIRDRKIEKYYECLVENPPPRKTGELVHYLVKDAQEGYVSVYDNETHHGKQAMLYYEQTGTVNSYAHLRVKLITGRTHQIRAQLAHIGCPVVGDDKYGAKNTKVPVQLFSTCIVLHFQGALKKYDAVRIEVPPRFAF